MGPLLQNKSSVIIYDLFDDSINELKLSKPALRALATLEAFTLEKVRGIGKERIKELHGIGDHALKRLFP